MTRTTEQEYEARVDMLRAKGIEEIESIWHRMLTESELHVFKMAFEHGALAVVKTAKELSINV